MFRKNFGSLVKDPTVFCWITTMPSYHLQRAVHVRDTWAKRCDKYVFISSLADPEFPSVALTDGDNYGDLWNKTRSALIYLYKNHIDTYDYFLKADDDTYVIVDNLKSELKNYKPNVPTLIGFTHPRFFKSGYVSGGAGYALSRAALRSLIQGLTTQAMCMNQEHSANEDVKITACAIAMNVSIVHSLGKNKKERFMWQSPFNRLSEGKLSIPLLSGLSRPRPAENGCCAENHVSFHYIKPAEMHFLDYLLYEARSDYSVQTLNLRR